MKTVDQVDLVLMDGSLHSQFMTRQSTLDALDCKNNEKEKQCNYSLQKHQTQKNNLKIRFSCRRYFLL